MIPGHCQQKVSCFEEGIYYYRRLCGNFVFSSVSIIHRHLLDRAYIWLDPRLTFQKLVALVAYATVTLFLTKCDIFKNVTLELGKNCVRRWKKLLYGPVISG